MKKAGILHHVSSLPSNYGVGDFGDNAYKFVDMLAENGVKIWQILPLNPIGYGSSPYQPYSSFAGEDIYISLDKLKEIGLLDEVKSFQEDSIKVEFDEVRKYKETYYQKAYHNFIDKCEQFADEFKAFLDENSWLEMYAIFYSFKVNNELQSWVTWDDEMKFYPERKSLDLTPYDDDIKYIQFKQFIFFKQWLALKSYANEKGIEIIGDVPIYVAEDSQDVWENKEVFMFNEDYSLKYLAGCPPDDFSETGQLWGNPIYNWDMLRETNFDFLVNRFKTCGIMYDVTRIDHFLGFDRYWRIPGGSSTAENGEWIDAYGEEFFIELYKKFPEIKFIAEDLGSLRPKTYELRDKFNLPGMKLLMFSVKDDYIEDFPGENMIAYTGTHDNVTMKSMIDSFTASQLETFKTQYADYDENASLVWNYINFVLNDEAKMVIIPTQDILELGDEGRFNVPSTVGDHNWTWKLADFDRFSSGISTFKSYVERARR